MSLSHGEYASGEAPHSGDAEALEWSVHLARRNRRMLPGVILALISACSLVTMLFCSPIPGIVAVLLLIGSIKEYLFPIYFRVSAVGVASRSFGSEFALAWTDVRRGILERKQLTLTPLPSPSRLDPFRGVTLRFAECGKPGDRASVLERCRAFLPELECLQDCGTT